MISFCNCSAFSVSPSRKALSNPTRVSTITLLVPATAPVAPNEYAYEIFESDPTSKLKSLCFVISAYAHSRSSSPLLSLIALMFSISANLSTSSGSNGHPVAFGILYKTIGSLTFSAISL